MNILKIYGFGFFVVLTIFQISCTQNSSILTKKESALSSNSSNVKSANSAEVKLPNADEIGVAPQPTTPSTVDIDGGSYRYADLTVQASITKPLTQLNIVLDDSSSMTEIQNKTANALSQLMQEISNEKLNVDVNLYTTTDLMYPRGPNVRHPNGKDYSVGSALSTFVGSKGNSFFSDRTFFEVIDGNRRSLFAPSNRSASNFWVRDEIRLAGSKLSNNLFPGQKDGSLSFRENQNPSEHATLIAFASSSIRLIGVSGSDHEMPLSVFYRMLRDRELLKGQRMVNLIVTNEDDQTRKKLVTNIESEFTNPTSSSVLYANVGAQRVWMPYEAYFDPVYKDGVMITPGRWVSSNFERTIQNCKDNPLCNSASTVHQNLGCTSAQLSWLQSQYAAFSTADRKRNPVPNACMSQLYKLQYGHRYFSTPTTCDQLDGSTGSTYRTNFEKLSSNHVLLDACIASVNESGALIKVLRNSVHNNSSDENEIGTKEIGDLILNGFNEKLGPKAYAFALIANLGDERCSQTSFAPATRLAEFMRNTPNPNLQASVCQDSYWDIVGGGIKNFITTMPILRYTFLDDPSELTEVQVLDVTTSLTRILNSSEYKIENQEIVFSPGSISVGEKIKFKYRVTSN